MRPLTKSESRLLAHCLLTVFIVGNLFFFQTYVQEFRADEEALVQIQSEIKANEVWVSDREIWEHHREWIEAKLPTMQSAGQAGGALLEELQQSAFDNRFEIVKQALLESRQHDHYQTVSASITLQGDLADLTQW